MKKFILILKNGGKFQFIADSWRIVSGLVCFRRIIIALNMNGTLTASSANVTVASTASLKAGYTVSGDGIDVGTTIASITNGTVFVLSAAATLSGSKALQFSDTNDDAQAGMILSSEVGSIVRADIGTFSGDLIG